jgi:hypothetical protein
MLQARIDCKQFSIDRRQSSAFNLSTFPEKIFLPSVSERRA